MAGSCWQIHDPVSLVRLRHKRRHDGTREIVAVALVEILAMTHDQWVAMRLSQIIRECRDRLIDVTTTINTRPERIITDNERRELELMKHEIDLLLSVDEKRKVA